MAIKPSQFGLVTWSNGNGYSEVKVHTRVCAKGGAKTLGVVTSIVPGDLEGIYHQRVTVRWFSGKKKGQETVEDVSYLSDYDAYKEALVDLLIELDEHERKVGCIKP